MYLTAWIETPISTLIWHLEWFAFNAKDRHGVAKDGPYQDFPKKFSFDTKTKTWKLRTKSTPAIGHMYFLSPAQGERFYLRLLLTAVPGATSFKFLQTHNGREVDSFKTACLQCGLLENNTCRPAQLSEHCLL